jgi:hypothetical protein
MPPIPPVEMEHYPVTAPLHLQAGDLRRQYRARFITAGTIRAQGNRESRLVIPPETLQTALPLFNSRPTFIDHPEPWEHPSLLNMAGITLDDAAFDPEQQAIVGTIRLYDCAAGDIVADLFDQILADDGAGNPVPDVGLSATLWPRWKRLQVPEGELPLWAMDSIRHVESVDFVFEPGADGRVQGALAALQSLSKWGEPPPNVAHPFEPLGLPQGQTNHTERSITTMPPEETTPIEPSQPFLPHGEEWLRAMQQATAHTMIHSSGLPPAAQDHLSTQTFDTPEDVETAIEAQRAIVAALAESDVVNVGGQPPRSHQIALGRNSIEQIHDAFEALVAGVNPPEGIVPLSGIREFYTLLSGDYEMRGMFHPDRVYLANVTTSTMSNITANVLNKVVVNRYQEYPQWWAPIVTIEDFSSLQQTKWITLGGVGELPTVAEGAAYTEMTWDDAAETADFVKKGGYLGITLEAIDKDDTARLRAAPRALAQAAWMTLGKSVSAIFTANSDVGPTLADTGALFNATAVSSTGGHANLLTTALSWSQWNVVRIAMMKQTEVNSGERLGFLTAPRYCLVPIDLETTALQIMASDQEPGTADNDVNPFSDGEGRRERLQLARRRVIVVPFWTDTNNWAAVADPLLYPSIGLGFRYGRVPQVFSVASPTAGLMFTNDTLPVKVRFFYAVGPTDYRGLHKSNVS